MIGQISIANLKRIQKVYYHGECPDGIGARTILQKYFDDVEYIPYYFEELKEVPSYALFIDCAPQAHQLKELLEKGGCIAEHHDSRLDELLELRKEHPQQILYGVGMESGAFLALEILSLMGEPSNGALEEVAHLLAIGDTWQKEDPGFVRARKFANYIRFFGNDFNISLEELLKREAQVEEYDLVQKRLHRTQVDRAIILQQQFREHLRIAFINDSELNISDASDLLRQQGIPLTVGWTVKTYLGKRSIVYSMRSKPEVIDVGAFAKLHGGGGHKPAAGFIVDYAADRDPIQYFMYLMSSTWRP
jgi:nanoRNase/pAp phosphatase (c-di-AMP/oligoRNAs hydrolase)